MTVHRALRRFVVAAAVIPATLLVGHSPAQAVELPPACQAALTEAQDKFPAQQFTVPDKAKTAILDELAALGETDQKALTETACAAWNKWATTNGAAVARNLDTRYQNTDGLACTKFTTAAIGALKKYAPTIPAETRGLETVAKKVWGNAMRTLSVEATNATCRRAYGSVKAGW
ncbi:hypothetical protein F0L17_25730 [Streptomyces sp. TRM43335]|uniref:Small secreted protein n=1 Tax=Streptomyces taklimakanensis TaxID=2569853 RepID=A0A6G2BJL6_9ACTN|nr:hypothetical protein [Streptomyces taklimakanensis]MTE22440.1 hypothetical protein [Streptomyces taklimakanensis]